MYTAIVHTGMYSPSGKYSTHISKYRKYGSKDCVV